MKAIHAVSYGDARQSLHVVELQAPSSPGPGEVLVNVEYAPLNKHDLFAIAGVLHAPPVPFVPGNEGMGFVAVLGDGVENVAVGDRVVLPLLSGSWREQLVIPAAGLFALPEADPQQLAMSGSNPPSAVLMLQEYAALPEGGYIVQNAANSGVGRSVIAIAKARGLKTINFARNIDTFDELKAAGGDIVLQDTPEAVASARQQIGDAPVLLAIDGVGGASTMTLTDTLSDGGVVVAYAAESGQPLWVHPFALTAKHITVRGFFIGEWDFATKTAPAVQQAAPLIGHRRADGPRRGRVRARPGR